jgi:hypothetical protein
VWQAATVLLAAGAVGLIVLPLARALRPSEINWDGAVVRPAGAGGAGGTVTTLSLADANSLANILSELSPKAEEVPPPEEEPGDEGQNPDENGLEGTPLNPGPSQQAAPRANWVYLGSAITPRASRALVRIDQTQKFIRQGTELEGVKLLEVHDDHIVIEEGAEGARMQKRIDRAPLLANSMLSPPRTGTATAAGNRPGVQTPPTPPAPGSAAAMAKAREDALAAAEAAHGRIKNPAAKPDQAVSRILSLPPELRTQVFTTLTSTAASYEEKLRALSELGLGSATFDQRREAIRALQLDPDSPEILRLLEDEMAGGARDDR